MARIVRIACLIGIVAQFGGPAAQLAPGQTADDVKVASADLLQRQELEVDGRPAFLILPKERNLKPIPWVLYAPTLLPGLPGEAEHWMFERFIKAGIAIAGVDVGESYGSPKGRSIYSTLHKVLVEEHGLAPRACLLARSRHGTIHGAMSAQGRLDKALLFDRSRGDHVSIPYSGDFEISTFTVAAWVKLTKEPTFSGILGTRFGGEFTFDMKVNADKVHGDVGDGERWIETKVNFYADDVGSNDQGGDLTTDHWYQITFVVDDDAKRFRLYLNGDKKKEIAYQGTPRLMKPGQTMRMGCSSSDEFMDGLIDDVQIWSLALSDQQVRTLAPSATGAGGE